MKIKRLNYRTRFAYGGFIAFGTYEEAKAYISKNALVDCGNVVEAYIPGIGWTENFAKPGPVDMKGISRDEPESDGVRDGELLGIAEARLYEAVKNYLRRGANEDLVLRVVNEAICEYKSA